MRSLALLVIAGFAYAANVSGAVGPGVGRTATVIAEAPVLTMTGADLTITGSTAHLFQSDTFVGPNSAAKRDRRRGVDLIDFSKSFEAARQQLAGLRTANDSGRPHSSVAAGIDEAPRVSIASLSPRPNTPALNAIDAATGRAEAFDGPLPMTLSSALAYARDNAPATDFSKLPSAIMSEKELWCLASAIYFEARGETYRGQIAVAQVVLNRTKHRLYPETICGVVFQNQNQRNACQFSFACDGIPETITDRRSWAQAEEIAKGAVDGRLYLAEVNSATHYHASYVYPHWAPRMAKITRIGLHVFYRFKTGWQFG